VAFVRKSRGEPAGIDGVVDVDLCAIGSINLFLDRLFDILVEVDAREGGRLGRSQVHLCSDPNIESTAARFLGLPSELFAGNEIVIDRSLEGLAQIGHGLTLIHDEVIDVEKLAEKAAVFFANLHRAEIVFVLHDFHGFIPIRLSAFTTSVT
jgi:hypothetical protein